MKKLLSNKIIQKSFAFIVCVTIFVGCGSGVCTVTPTASGTAITIDNSGVIPVFGNQHQP